MATKKHTPNNLNSLQELSQLLENESFTTTVSTTGIPETSENKNNSHKNKSSVTNSEVSKSNDELLLQFPHTQTFCCYSGLPIQVDTYFGQKIKAARHWIFDQNPAAIFKLALTARTLQQKKLTQLAILNTLNVLIFDAPLHISESKLYSNHVKLVEIFTLWLKATQGERKRLRGGFDSSRTISQTQPAIFPQFKVSELSASNGNFYSDFVDLIEDHLLNYYNLDSLEVAKHYLDSDQIELAEFEVTIRKELREFARISPNRYSKEVGRKLLETLCEYPDNSYLRENFKQVSSYLLNEGFKTADNYALVYRTILDAQLEGNGLLEHRKTTLNWLQVQIELLLELEAGFFGKKSFISSTGQIENVSVLYSIEDSVDAKDFEKDEKAKIVLQKTKKHIFQLKPKS